MGSFDVIISDLVPGELIISFLVETVRKLCDDTNVIVFKVLCFTFVTTKRFIIKTQVFPC